ncbi:accessory gene regulator ArgB-like protein [Cohnella sp. REN36]|uniref:accessory gene regulator ArgB-like protein n=1 Tax=Cohnella sp. REN36 TaxID=2887347 RepID=UPI001D14F375|nr:accessory gene regulator B family protein [Cohnella sp. REN36]MCC3377159.1 accessory gene regulator B family protein [Cohnella sp. REN36]
MIPRLARTTARWIKGAAPDHPVSIDVLVFSLQAIINVVSIVIVTIAISLITGKIEEAIMALIAFGALRQVSGGLHLKSGDLCVLVSVIGITLISFSNFNSAVIYIVTSISLCLAALFAPSRIENQTRIPERYFPALKIISLLIIGSNFFIQSPILAVAWFVQGLTLIKPLGAGNLK